MRESTKEENKSLNPAAWVDDYGDYLYSYAISRLRDRFAYSKRLTVEGSRRRDYGRGQTRWPATDDCEVQPLVFPMDSKMPATSILATTSTP
jgi:hypothetical protein